MNIEDNWCSIEYAKKLKEIGVIHESLFSFLYNDIVKYQGIISTKDYKRLSSEGDICSAFTVSELMDILPYSIMHEKEEYFLNIEKYEKEYRSYYIDYEYEDEIPLEGIADKSLANTLAKLLIHIIEQKII